MVRYTWVCVAVSVTWPLGRPDRGHDWLLVYCGEKSFKLKQNGAQNVWLHQTCSAQCEVNEMWQTLLFRLRPCNLFHNKVFARPCQRTLLPSLWRNRLGMIRCNWAHCGAIERVWSCFICMLCFPGTSVRCHNCLHWKSTLLQESDSVCTEDKSTKKKMYDGFKKYWCDRVLKTVQIIHRKKNTFY